VVIGICERNGKRGLRKFCWWVEIAGVVEYKTEWLKEV
jgi:hypothetical protein